MRAGGRSARPRVEYRNGLCYHPPRPRPRVFFTMPNIKQQKKRVRSAARQRLQNLHYRSTVKTLTRRLEAAVRSGEPDRAAAEHRELVRWIDRAAAHRALHKNTAARRKARAAKLLSDRRYAAAASAARVRSTSP